MSHLYHYLLVHIYAVFGTQVIILCPTSVHAYAIENATCSCVHKAAALTVLSPVVKSVFADILKRCYGTVLPAHALKYNQPAHCASFSGFALANLLDTSTVSGCNVAIAMGHHKVYTAKHFRGPVKGTKQECIDEHTPFLCATTKPNANFSYRRLSG
jgi:hypothetical protein